MRTGLVSEAEMLERRQRGRNNREQQEDWTKEKPLLTKTLHLSLLQSSGNKIITMRESQSISVTLKSINI